VRHYYNQHQAAVEIDLRPYRLADKSEADWQNVVLHEAARTWLSPPLAVRQAREAEARRLRRPLKIAAAIPRLKLLRFIERQRDLVDTIAPVVATTPRPSQTATAEWRTYWLRLAEAQHYQATRVREERQRLDFAEQRLRERNDRAFWRW
jgi:hypothetical protein